MANLDKKPSDFKKKNDDSDEEKDKKPSFGKSDDSGSDDKDSKPSFGRDGEGDDNDASAKQDGEDDDARPGEGEGRDDNPDDTENGRPGEGGEDQDGDGEADDERTSHQKIKDGDSKPDAGGSDGDSTPITIGDLKALIASKGGDTGEEEGKPTGQTDTGLKSSIIDTKPKVESFSSWRDSVKH